MMKDGTKPNLDLGDLLGSKYKNIVLVYKFTNGKLLSVFPTVR